MPYIPKQERDRIVAGYEPRNPGELNFEITRVILVYLDDKKAILPSFGTIPEAKMPNKYSDYNEIIGVLECVKQELYRRLIAPYEDKKCEQEGDVF